MMPDWIPRLSDDMLLMLFGGLVAWTIMALMPEAKRIIAIAWPWSRTSRARIAKLESELSSLKEQQEQLPASVRQEVHVHTAERRETVGDTLFGALLGLPSPQQRKRTHADRIRDEVEEAARDVIENREDDG